MTTSTVTIARSFGPSLVAILAIGLGACSESGPPGADTTLSESSNSASSSTNSTPTAAPSVQNPATQPTTANTTPAAPSMQAAPALSPNPKPTASSSGTGADDGSKPPASSSVPKDPSPMASATAAPSVEPEPSSSSTDEAGGGANQQPTGASDPSSSTPSMPSAGPEPASGEAKPSAGCGKSGKPSGGEVMTSEGHIYRFPDGYDGSKPFPLLIGFHACGNANTEFLNLTQGSKFETDYVRAFPRSSDASGMCWSYDADIDTRVLAAFDDLLATYCIDENRIFATGHSSGAQMIVQILTHKDAAEHLGFKAVAPVAASDYGSLSLPVPVMYIQGKNDSVRGEDGASTVARFATANGCSSGSDPYADVMGCQSSGTSVDPGCVEYQDCSVPTIWCSHNDPQYNGTSHGVPCFAIGAMYDFFSTLP